NVRPFWQSTIVVARPLYSLHQAATSFEGWCRAVGRRRGSARYCSHVRTSTSAGAPGSPIRRDSCATVISVGEGMAASTSGEDMDAIFRPGPHGAIAVDPLSQVQHHKGAKVNSWRAVGHVRALRVS